MVLVPSKFLVDRNVAIIGVPFNGGQPVEGVEKGPILLVESGLAEQLQELGWKPSYESNEHINELKPASDPDTLNLKRPKFVSAVTQLVTNQVYERASKGKFVLTLGGDHSISLGTVSGLFKAYPDACLVWVDAHADLNTPSVTPSGNIHGCPLGFLTGLSTEHPDFQWVKAVLGPSRLVYIGLRDLDLFERTTIKALGIKAFTMHHIDKWGIGKVMDMALDHVNPYRNRPIHLSFDVDALDPTVAPSTGTPVRGGLTFREGHYICEALAETGLLVAADVVEVNPSLEDETAVAQTVAISCSLARCCLAILPMLWDKLNQKQRDP